MSFLLALSWFVFLTTILLFIALVPWQVAAVVVVTTSFLIAAINLANHYL